TIPIASRVGGMVDTIVDPGHAAETNRLYRATGILFDGETAADIRSAIERAVTLRQRPLVWRTMQRNAMLAPMGWERSAPLYGQLYQSLRPDVAPIETVGPRLQSREVGRNVKRRKGPGRAAPSLDAVVPAGT